MMAETAPRPVRPVRAHDDNQNRASYWVLAMAVGHLLLHDRRFHATVVTGVIGAVALADLLKNNHARPMRRVAAWYGGAGASQGLARARRAVEPGKRS